MAQPADAGSSIQRDLGYKLKVVNSIVPIVANDTAEGTGIGVDLKDYEGAVVVITIGVSADTLSGSVKIQPAIQECDTDTPGSYADIPAAALRAENGDLTLIDDPAEDAKQIVVTILPGTGRKRWVRALLTFTGTHTNGITVSAFVIKGHPRVVPAA